MTDSELLSERKITPEIAARYLQGGYTAQDIRLDARDDICPFCTAKRNPGGRYSYRIIPGLLIKYKAGELGLHGDRLADY